MKILDYILCEDIREEVGRKLTLVGTFHDQIVFHQTKDHQVKWPVTLRLAIYLKVMFEETDQFDSLNVFFIEEKSGVELFKLAPSLPPDLKKNAPVLLNFVLQNIQISAPTELTLRIEGIKNGNITATITPELQYKVSLKEEGKDVVVS